MKTACFIVLMTTLGECDPTIERKIRVNSIIQVMQSTSRPQWAVVTTDYSTFYALESPEGIMGKIQECREEEEK